MLPDEDFYGMFMYVFVFLKVLLFVSLFISCYFLILESKRRRFWREKISRAYYSINSISDIRKLGRMKKKELYGAVQDNFLSRMDAGLVYSGISLKFPFINTELCIAGMFVVCSLSFMVVLSVSGHWPMALFAIILEWLAALTVLSVLSEIRYRLVEAELLPFMNMVGACANSSDDLAYILERAALSVGGPIRETVLCALSRAKMSGDVSEALGELEGMVENKFFKNFIRNLENCSRGKANYSEVVAECRSMLHSSRMNHQELKNIYRESSHEMLIICAVGVGGLFILSENVVGISVLELADNLQNSFFGSLILAYNALVFVGALYYILLSKRKGR